MTQAVHDPAYWAQRRDAWIARVEALIDQIEQWATEEGWATARGQKPTQEKLLGQYTVPTLRVRLAGGELHVVPVALHVVGADGRVDIESFPTLNRVKLVGRGNEWQINTDSNVPLRQPWNRQTFAQLAQDLLA